MEDLFNWIKKHMKIVVVVLVLIVFVVPFLINILFKYKAPIILLEAEWDAADMLGYYGAVLGFLSTTFLSILAIWQNEKIRQMEEAKEAPALFCRNRGCNGNYANLSVSLVNANSNSMIYDINPIEFRIVNESGVVVSSDDKGKIDKTWLGGNEQIANIKFKNKTVNEDNLLLSFKIKCFDVYQKEHIYEFRQFIEKATCFSGSTPYFIKEL